MDVIVQLLVFLLMLERKVMGIGVAKLNSASVPLRQTQDGVQDSMASI
jgi:hypothetical protein